MSEIVLWGLTVLAGFALVAEVRGWLRVLSRFIVRRAAKRLPPESSKRWEEEILRHVEDERPLTGLVRAVGMLASAKSLRAEVEEEPSGEAVESWDEDLESTHGRAERRKRTRRGGQRWQERQQLGKVRLEAYRRYLIAQQELADELAKRTGQPLSSAALESDAGRAAGDSIEPPSADWLETDKLRSAAVWGESGAAEMSARLVAGEWVHRAIDKFEEFARNFVRAVQQAEKPSEDDWENARTALIEEMRDELTALQGRWWQRARIRLRRRREGRSRPQG